MNASIDAKRRQTIKSLSLAGLLANGGLMGFMQRALANGTHPAPPGLHKLKGRVTVNGQIAHAGQLLKPGDTVVTAANSEAIYVIDQDAFLQRGDSTVNFGQTAANFMRIVSGRLLAVFGTGERQIKFATATIGIRGTACYIEEEPAKVGAGGTATTQARTYFCLCYGEALVIPAAAPEQQETIRTSHHDHPLYLYDDRQMPSMMVTAPVINHTDAELILLENLVGRWPPFYGKVDSPY